MAFWKKSEDPWDLDPDKRRPAAEEEEAENPQLTDLSETYTKVDEIPFDFNRRRLTTVVQDKKGKTQMVTKGAVEEMLSICAFAECD